MHLINRAAKFYINWLYLVTLLRNAVIVATYALIQAYNQSGGHPNWGLIYMVAGLAFLESLIEHTGNARLFALLQLIWQALQQLNPQSLAELKQSSIPSEPRTGPHPVPPRASEQRKNPPYNLD